MKKILIAISDSFPYGAAYAARTRALCKLLRAAGYETDVLCDWCSGGSDTAEYGHIYSVSERPYSGAKKLLLLPRDYQKKLDALLRDGGYDCVIARSMFDRFGKLLSTVRKHGIPIVLESCEWYDVKGFRRGKKDIRYRQFIHCFQKTYNRVDGVIAISRLLEAHYRERGIPVVRIPGIHDIDKLPYRTECGEGETLNLIFGGNIFGGKDQFSQLLVALSRLQAGKTKILLHVYGVTESQVLDSLDDAARDAYERISGMPVFHGSIPQEAMAQACLEGDLGVFFRPDRRSSHAGFPTKLGEYLAAGTPVLANDTGDLSLVLKNGENGFLLPDSDPDKIREALENYLQLSTSERCAMRERARESAARLLDYRGYQEEIKAFLESL